MAWIINTVIWKRLFTTSSAEQNIANDWSTERNSWGWTRTKTCSVTEQPTLECCTWNWWCFALQRVVHSFCIWLALFLLGFAAVNSSRRLSCWLVTMMLCNLKVLGSNVSPEICFIGFLMVIFQYLLDCCDSNFRMELNVVFHILRSSWFTIILIFEVL